MLWPLVSHILVQLQIWMTTADKGCFELVVTDLPVSEYCQVDIIYKEFCDKNAAVREDLQHGTPHRMSIQGSCLHDH